MGLVGSQIDETDAQVERIVSGSSLVLFNAHDGSVSFHLSARARDLNWELVFDTSSTSMGSIRGRNLATLSSLVEGCGSSMCCPPNSLFAQR
jgi:hypothetical protein